MTDKKPTYAAGEVSRTDKKDATTKAAQDIINAELVSRAAKTERLRQAREAAQKDDISHG